MKQKLLALSLVGISLLPYAALAQVQVASPSPVEVRDIGDLLDAVNRIVNIIFTALMIAAVIFILLAAFGYLTAAGDPAKVSKAQNMLIYAGVAIAVGLVAFSIPIVVRSILE